MIFSLRYFFLYFLGSRQRCHWHLSPSTPKSFVHLQRRWPFKALATFLEGDSATAHHTTLRTAPKVLVSKCIIIITTQPKTNFVVNRLFLCRIMCYTHTYLAHRAIKFKNSPGKKTREMK